MNQNLWDTTIAKRFDNIIAVMEQSNDKYKNYYLTKSGKKVGIDSLFIYDNSPDCENEGFIRFTDYKTDKVGMFDKNGNITIPAEYNALLIVQNGLIWGLKDAEKDYLDKHIESGCNHYIWKGGKEFLNNINNHVLVENFKLDHALNFYTLEKTEKPHSDSNRKSFLAVDGSYYSFIEFEKEFKHWLTKDLIVNLTPEKLMDNSFNMITWESENGWKKTDKNKLITTNFKILKSGLLEITEPKTDYFISTGELNPYMYKGSQFDKYYNDCLDSKYWLYPTMSLIVNHKDQNNFSQNHYEFLRTDDGYKLISVVIRDKKMK